MVALAPTPRPRRRAAPSGPSTGAAAAVQKTYVYGNYIDEVIQIRDHRPTAGPTDQYAHQDDLFSVVALTDANGDVTERFRYGDYGNREALTAAGSPSGSTELRHGFTGRLHDDLVGLIEYRHRWMQPGTGTFVQRDPLRYLGGRNLFAVAGVNPFVRNDPLGLIPSCPICRDSTLGPDTPWNEAVCLERNRPFFLTRAYHRSMLNACADWVRAKEHNRSVPYSRCVFDKLVNCCMNEIDDWNPRPSDCSSKVYDYQVECGDLQSFAAPIGAPCWANCAACITALALAGAGFAIPCTAAPPVCIAILLLSAVDLGIAIPTVCTDCVLCL